MYEFYRYFPRCLFPLLSYLPFYIYCVCLSRMLYPPGFYQYRYINRFFGVLSSEWVQPVGGFTSVWKLYKKWSQCSNSVTSLSVILLGFHCIPQSVVTISLRWLIPHSLLFQVLMILDSPLIS